MSETELIKQRDCAIDLIEDYFEMMENHSPGDDCVGPILWDVAEMVTAVLSGDEPVAEMGDNWQMFGNFRRGEEFAKEGGV